MKSKEINAHNLRPYPLQTPVKCFMDCILLYSTCGNEEIEPSKSGFDIQMPGEGHYKVS